MSKVKQSSWNHVRFGRSEYSWSSILSEKTMLTHVVGRYVRGADPEESDEELVDELPDEFWPLESDDDDEGREQVQDPLNLVGLLDYLSGHEQRGTVITRATHCANYWFMCDTVLPLQHHGLIFELSDGHHLRLHLLRDGLAWKTYCQKPSLPDNLVFSVQHAVNNSAVTGLKQFCAENSSWLWPTNDCEKFAKGALKSVGVVEKTPSVKDQFRGWLSNLLELVDKLDETAEDHELPRHFKKMPTLLASARQSASEAPTKAFETATRERPRLVLPKSASKLSL